MMEKSRSRQVHFVFWILSYKTKQSWIIWGNHMRQGKSVQSPGYKENVLNHVDKILYCSWLDGLYIGSIPFKIWYVSAPAWKGTRLKLSKFICLSSWMLFIMQKTWFMLHRLTSLSTFSLSQTNTAQLFNIVVMWLIWLLMKTYSLEESWQHHFQHMCLTPPPFP